MTNPRGRRRVATIVASLFALFMCWGSGVAQVASPEATPAATGIEGAVAWLVSQQAADGSFSGFSGEPDAGVTVDAVTALAAAAEAGIETAPAIDLALTYLVSGDVALVYVQTGVGQAAKLVLALHAAGRDPLDFAHVQPLTIVENGLDPDTGLYGTGVFDHALALMALTVTGAAVPPEALDALAATQGETGGWAFDGSPDLTMSDSNTTALVIQALVAAGMGESDLVADGFAYLESTLSDGAASYNDADESIPDANSTAFVAQALLAGGQDAAPLLAALGAFQNASGAFHYNAEDTSDNLFATLQAIPALAQMAYPIEPSAQASAEAPHAIAAA